jgi:D-glycerate 3-kinase
MDRQSFTQTLWRWIRDVIERTPSVCRPVVVGFSAPQGAGKTTAAAALCRMAGEEQFRVVAVSIDDFYLTRAQQVDLSRRHPGNRFLEQRGYPGTHDIALGKEVLGALKHLRPGEQVAVPCYDRSAASGHGDRRPASEWPRATGPLDLVILEGWMLGFKPIDQHVIVDPHLRTVNKMLERYGAWTAFVDAFIWLEPEDYRHVVDWRAEAEADAWAVGRGGMSDADVRAFATGFLPAYETYLPGLRRGSPVKGPTLSVLIGRDRLPVDLSAGVQG